MRARSPAAVRTTASVSSSDRSSETTSSNATPSCDENAPDRLGEMGRAVAGRDGDGQEWARLMGRHASLDLSARRGPVRPEHARFPT